MFDYEKFAIWQLLCKLLIGFIITDDSTWALRHYFPVLGKSQKLIDESWSTSIAPHWDGNKVVAGGGWRHLQDGLQLRAAFSGSI